MNNNEIKTLISKLANIPIAALADTELLADVLVDSFAIVDLSIAIQEELDILFIQKDLVGLNTVGDLVCLIKSKSALASI